MFFKLKFKIISLSLRVASLIFGYQIPPVPSVSAIFTKHKKILVVKLSYKTGFALPGGFLKGNEDFETAIKRETKEETGLEISSLKYFGTYFTTEPYSKVNVTYLAKAKGKLRSSREGTPFWKSLKGIVKELVYEDNRRAIKEYMEK